MINLIYNKEKAENLKKECDIKFKKLYDSVSNDKNKKRNRVKIFSFIGLSIIGIIIAVLLIIKTIIDDITLLVIPCGIFLAMAIAGLTLSGMYTSCIFENEKKNKYDYQHNKGEYSYPVLVDFYNQIGNKKILKLELEAAIQGKLLNVEYEEENGIIRQGSFYLTYNSSTAVTETTINLETEEILFPVKDASLNFIVKETV